jgi:dephospho-CoA kinase
MLTIGVVGGVASGKSQVAKRFEELGCLRLDGDVIGHEVLRDNEVKAILRDRWGAKVITAEGEVDRRAVAGVVFSGDSQHSAAQLEFLESVTHPRIAERLSARLSDARQQGLSAVLDAAVMMKAGWDKMCDHIVFVDVPRPIRLQRALQRGWTEEQFLAREHSQLTLTAKRERADTTIDNSGSLEETFQQVQILWDAWSAKV